MNNLPIGQAASQGWDSGAGGTLGGAAQAGPAHPGYTVGSVGFAANWPHELADEVMDQMADSIVELTGKLEEAEARVAVLEEEQKILKGDGVRIAIKAKSWTRLAKERDEERLRVRSLKAFASSLVKTIGELKAGRVELKATIESLRDALCADKCRDKAAADGNWVNC